VWDFEKGNEGFCVDFLLMYIISLVISPLQISTERQGALTRLCTGRAVMATNYASQTDLTENGGRSEKKATADVEGVNYRVVWSCLLMIEMIMTNLSAASYFSSLAANAVGKIIELLRLFNSRATHLVLGAGAIHAAARLKSINAKHLSMVTQSLGMTLSLLPHIRAALMAQLPPKQHTLLSDFDKIKKDYLDHSEMVLNKFVTIIGGIVEHGLAPRIANTDFDARARDLPIGDNCDIACCVFLDGVSTNTRKMHQVLHSLLPPDHLQDVFSRILAYVDQKVPTLFIATAAATNTPNGVPSFHFPSTDEGKRRLLLEVDCTTKRLNALQGVVPWDFTAVNALERKLDYTLTRENVNGSPAAENGTSPPVPDSESSEKGAPDGEEKTEAGGDNPVEEHTEETEAETDKPVENEAAWTETEDEPKTDG
jgi:vacuolar protein sorting-associated protein 54